MNLADALGNSYQETRYKLWQFTSREINLNSKDVLNNPGPGQYDVNFTEELKILDHKLSARYKNTPFGGSSNRFNIKEFDKKVKNKQPMENDSFQYEEGDTVIGSCPLANNLERRKRCELINDQVKKNEENRPSFMFKSQATRFRRNEDASKTTMGNFQREMKNEKVLVSERKQMNKSRNKLDLFSMGANSTSKGVGFNTQSSRFGEKKVTISYKFNLDLR